MKKLLTLLAAILLCGILFPQKGKNKDSNIPAFGKVDKAELEMKECDFDKKAAAMVLFQKGELVCIIGPSNLSMDFKRHVRIKILSDKGLKQADIHIPYQSWGNVQSIIDLSAQTYNLDANGNIVVTKLDKKQFLEKKLNKRLTEKVFTFPEVKPGSVIEYQYTRRGAGLFNWYFQNDIPVKYSQYEIDFPAQLEVMSTPFCSLPYEKKDNSSNTRSSYVFSMENVPPMRDEPYIINAEDYRERVESRVIAYYANGRREPLTTTWPKVVKELMEDEDFGRQRKREVPRTADLDAALIRTKSEYEKMKTILNYVRKNMEWNGYNSIWAQDGVRSAWKDKKGTAGEINLILINLLRDAGLSARPILVSTHDHGIIKTAYPGSSQFNKVLAYVEINNKRYFLDATEKETPPHLIPKNVLMTEGLKIDKPETMEWGWTQLWEPSMNYKNLVLVQGAIAEDGKMTGEAGITSYDYARLDRQPVARKGQKEFIEKFLTGSGNAVSVDSVIFEGLDQDSIPLGQKVYFNQQLNSSGDYSYFSLNLFSGLEKNPFVADKRFSDIFFGTKQQYNLVGNISIPENYDFEELPKNVRMILPDTSISFTRAAQVVAGRLTYRIILDFNRPYYMVENYPEFSEFYKKLFDMLNEQYVIRKKS